MRPIKVVGVSQIPLGKQGENKATQVIFDISENTEYTIVLLHKRIGDTIPYEVSDYYISENELIWIVNDTDTSVVGHGKLELQFRDSNGTLIKSRTYITSVVESLGDNSGEAPDPYIAWYDKMVDRAAAAESAKDKAEDAANFSSEYASNSKESAEKSESYAELSREYSESASNSADLAEEYANSASESAEHAEQVATKNGYVFFDIDDSGNLIETRSENFPDEIEFTLNNDGTMGVTFK